uniref:Uncharacterized protein n=1 Tax=Pithovirus LCPAC406 TaxID=2506599 RepID=A0A481ZFL2_9VIRU|nr:MAG: hypothetical protein LCPAC406_02260 [Pithovirus LCPAC406]
MHYHLEVYLPKDTDVKNWDEVENLIEEYMKPYDENNEEKFENVRMRDLSINLRPTHKIFVVGKDDSGKDIFSDKNSFIGNMTDFCNPIAFWNSWKLGGVWDKYHKDNVIEISEFRKLKLNSAPRILLISPHKPFYSEEIFLYGKWDCDVLAKLDKLEITDGYLVTVDCRI